jgi:hypothetical protein
MVYIVIFSTHLPNLLGDLFLIVDALLLDQIVGGVLGEGRGVAISGILEVL